MLRNCLFVLVLLTSQAFAQAPPVAIGPTITDPGFETPAQGTGKFTKAPAGSPWTFTGNAGLTGNGSGFTVFYSSAPQGQQVALLQTTAAISQTVKGWPAGPAILTMQAAQRGNWPTPGGSHQDIAVSIDGQVAATIRPVGYVYQVYYAMLPAVAAGDHVLTLSGTNAAGGDNTAFVDNVSIVPSLPTPVTVDDAWIGSSGKTLGFHFALAGQSPPLATQVIASPVVYPMTVLEAVTDQPAEQLVHVQINHH